MRCRRRSRKTADIWNTWTRGKCRNLMRMKCTMHLRFFPLFFRLFLERLGCFTQILFLHFLVIRFLLWVKLNSCQNYYTLGLFQELKKTHKRTDPFVVLQSNTTVRSLALTYWGRKNTHVCQERSAVIRTHAYALTHARTRLWLLKILYDAFWKSQSSQLSARKAWWFLWSSATFGKS